jgi:hypothetical protein
MQSSATEVSRRMRGWLVALAVGAVVVAGAVIGCSPKSVFQPNLPPETVLFVQGQVDTVNHVVHLFWFGSDQDGFVTGYEVRFKNPSNPGDTAWVHTTRTDSIFTVFTPAGLAMPVFEVRSIDDEGARDASPAVQAFTFSNKPPSIRLNSPPGAQDTTFASLTLNWTPSDIDGDVTAMTYLVWLDGNQANPVITTATTYTVPTSAFREGGQLLSRFRTVYVQPIDDGGLAGNADSTRWYVRAPVTGARARLLIIDDLPSSNPSSFSTDSFFTNAAIRNIPAGEWSVLRMETTQPFDSNEDVRQTFELFEAVIWYRGTMPTFSPQMQLYQQGISDYLNNGGSVFLEGLDLVEGLNAPGALTQSFMREHLGSDQLFRHFEVTQQDSLASWGVGNFRTFQSSVYMDSLRSQGIFQGLRAFVVRDTNDVVLWARAGTLSQTHTYDIPVSVSVPQPSGGRAIVLTLPLRGANGFLTVPRYLPKVMEQMGILGP